MSHGLAIIAWMLVIAYSVPFTVPRAALPYKPELIAQSRSSLGPTAPVALLAAQIEAESSWNPKALSPSGDLGLAQISPMTARYLNRIRPGPGPGSPKSKSQKWTFSAQSYYLLHLREAIKGTRDDCEHWAMSMAAYVGGLGWVNKERAICSRTQGCDPSRWFGHTEKHRARSKRAFKESRQYVRKIFNREKAYASWGPTSGCENRGG